MNRKEFIENFDYNIFVSYIKNINITPEKITHTIVNDLLNLIYSKYSEVNNKEIFSNFNILNNVGHCYVDNKDTYIYHNNIKCLEFEAFFPAVYYKKFIDNDINYNVNIFLLYSLLHHFRNICKKDYPELYNTFRILYHSYYGYLSIRKYIKKHFPYEYFINVCNLFHDNILYVDTDVLYLKDISFDDIEYIILDNKIDVPYKLYDVKCAYIIGKKNIITYFKDNDIFKFVKKGFFKKEDDVKIIQNKIVKDLRINKIANLLNNNE